LLFSWFFSKIHLNFGNDFANFFNEILIFSLSSSKLFSSQRSICNILLFFDIFSLFFFLFDLFFLLYLLLDQLHFCFLLFSSFCQWFQCLFVLQRCWYFYDLFLLFTFDCMLFNFFNIFFFFTFIFTFSSFSCEMFFFNNFRIFSLWLFLQCFDLWSLWSFTGQSLIILFFHISLSYNSLKDPAWKIISDFFGACGLLNFLQTNLRSL